MVYYNPSALKDYSNILYGLLTWPKHPLAPEHAKQYMRDIEKECSTLEYKSFHAKSSYNFHKKYGEYVYQYKRNQHTSWYIIYDKVNDDVFIERIMSNYMTMN
jgi:hypothetical protein